MGVAVGPQAGPLTGNVGGSGVTGTYGSLVINANGGFTYTVNNALPAVQQLGLNDTVTDTFSYSVDDGWQSAHHDSHRHRDRRK